MGISDVKKSSLASSPRALLTQANYLTRAETIELRVLSLQKTENHNFPSTLGTELPLREPFIRIADVLSGELGVCMAFSFLGEKLS